MHLHKYGTSKIGLPIIQEQPWENSTIVKGALFYRWEAWCARRGRHSPLLTGHDLAARLANETELIEFLVFLAWLGRGPGALRSHTFAGQGAHKRLGAGDPLLGMERVWLLLKKVRGDGVVRPRRLGVTPAMLRNIRAA